MQPQQGMGPILHQQQQQHPQHQQQQQQQLQQQQQHLQQHTLKPKQGVEIAPIIQPRMQVSSMVTKTLSSILPSTVAPIRPASSVATQTNTMVHGTLHPRPQLKQRTKGQLNRVMPGASGYIHIQQKADAANQTRINLTMPHIQPKPAPGEKMLLPVKQSQPQQMVTSTATGADSSCGGRVMVQPQFADPMHLTTVGVNVKKPDEQMDTSASSQMLNERDMQTNGGIGTPTALPVTSQHSNIVFPTTTLPTIASTVMPPSHAMSTQTGNNESPHQLADAPVSTIMVMQQSPITGVPHFEGVKEKHLQKAIVKPNILTHVIEGFVIQEASDPFPVNRSSLLADYTTPKPMPITEKDNKVPNAEQAALAEQEQHLQQANTCNSEESHPQEVPTDCWAGHESPGKYPKKKKHGMKIRKGMRKIHSSGRISYNTDEWVRSQNAPESLNKEEETNSSNSGAESSLSPATLSSQKDMMEVDITMVVTPNKNPLKWTVQDVFEFIKALPGCADYADEFRLQEIDGQALLLLKEDHLMTAMSMKLGPALKICARINVLKEEVQRQ